MCMVRTTFGMHEHLIKNNPSINNNLDDDVPNIDILWAN